MNFGRGKIILNFGNMPIFFQQDIDENTKLGIWKIEEDENFFLSRVSLQREITHPHKRLQHLAGRYLLRYLFPHFPVELIRIADTKKPYLKDEAYHFSISHCGDYAAVIASKNNRVGIDIEKISEKVERIRHKFVSDNEWVAVNNQWKQFTFPVINLSTLIWSGKEAAFKWYGLGGIDFKGHMIVQEIIYTTKNIFHSVVLFRKREELYLKIPSFFFEELCLSYVIT